MGIRFVDVSNQYIDRLVQICWENRASHENEVLRITERDDEAILGLINDLPIEAEDKENNILQTDSEIPSPPRKLNLSKFTAQYLDGNAQNPKNVVPIESLVCAVDAGIANLGDFVGGATAFAIRGACVCLFPNEIVVLRYNTGAIIVDESNNLPIFRYIGERLGKNDLYVSLDEQGNLVGRSAAFETTNQLQDRCRNFVERLIQEEAIGILVANGGGTLLLDGALPAGTFDTPVSYMESLISISVNGGVNIVAISKKTDLKLGKKRIPDLFDDDPSFIGYMPIREALRQDREDLVKLGVARDVNAISLGNEIYATKFGLGPPGISFRVDVCNSTRSTPNEALEYVFNACQIQSCYPKPLVDAHQSSSFFYQDIQSLTADVIARTGAIPKEDSSMDWIFQPFGAFGK